MKPQSDPLLTWKRRQRAIVAAGAIAIGGASIWSFRPLPQEVVVKTDPASMALPNREPAQTAPSASEFNTEAFANVRLWNPPPPPPVVEVPKPEAPEPPPRLELVGIIREGEELRAAVYDITEDRMLLLRAGDWVGPVTVKAVNEHGIQLTTGSQRTVKLELSKDE